VPGVRDGHQAAGAGRAEYILLPAVPAWYGNPKAETRKPNKI